MVVEAVVLDLPVRERRPTHPCGCYVAAIPRPGKMRWLRFPNHLGGMGLFNDRDAHEILERGWIVMNGVRARAYRDRADCPHWVQMDFDGAWTEPHP